MLMGPLRIVTLEFDVLDEVDEVYVYTITVNDLFSLAYSMGRTKGRIGQKQRRNKGSIALASKVRRTLGHVSRVYHMCVWCVMFVTVCDRLLSN
jgi:hypothetical protein